MKRLTVAARALFALAMLVSILVAGSTPSGAGTGTPVVDQEFTSPDNLSAPINACCRFSAQTFTAGRSGTLVGINLNVRAVGLSPLHVAIRTVSAGTPTATSLGETTLTSSGASLSQLITFPQTINVTAGVQYAIVVDYPDAPPPGSGRVQGVWNGAINDVYVPGRALATCDFTGCASPGAWFESLVGADQHFRTYVAARPAHPPNIFEVVIKRCKNLHVGYNYFPAGTVVHWNMSQGGVKVSSNNQFTTLGGGRDYHFLTMPIGTTLQPDPDARVRFSWTINGVHSTYVITRDNGC